MHRLSSSFVLGYHGCDLAVAAELLLGAPFKQSANTYDWLGHGIYFWEANPRRALNFATELMKLDRSPVKTPAIVGAVIDLGYCLDLTTDMGIEQVQQAYKTFAGVVGAAGGPLPTNSTDGLRRNLDCAVINALHSIREGGGEPPIDSVKGVFIEGGMAFPGSGLHAKTHIQLCVRNPACIKGVFRVAAKDIAA